jgi:hypothetical protein
MRKGGDRLSLACLSSAKSQAPPERQHGYAAPPLVPSQGEKSDANVFLASHSASFV